MLIKHDQKGFTLIELLIGMTLGMIAISALLSFVGFGIGVNGKTISKSKLAEETELILDVMSSEIKRSGFTAATIAMIEDPIANASVFRNSIVIGEHPSEAANSCILFSYDYNNNGLLDNLGINENFGFRHKNNQIQIRQDAALCDQDDSWENISNPLEIVVQSLFFTAAQVTIDGITRTQITIDIVTRSRATNQMSNSVSRNFLVRNYD
ncbi:prepilin-type N-terminal cleavage/methylation domain-containing protein [Glaciecola sp. MH2013]|uniref:prepilin-type N-terminal cleavage/methylation domain-containing protein n=1 Tax=Glaciecola sp. MH2013 TaxID=2785524 RepID=UPI001DA22625|nr:prepilin-type N-terminal cleavage/methylation domain-containing protein [Glaciecola sp. MH2013]MBF7073791.1 prepilin-type N-terminal cleavage/methylation domain-containing protein [Glaciecola sp. MH2013]